MDTTPQAPIPLQAQCWACGCIYPTPNGLGKFCSDACKQWAYRRRKANLPWHHMKAATPTVTPGSVPEHTEPFTASQFVPVLTEANGLGDGEKPAAGPE